MGLFGTCVYVLVKKLACPFGYPTQVSTQVQLAATCNYLRVRLAKALNLRKDLRWVAKRTGKSVSSQVHASQNKTILRQTYLVFH